MPRTDKDKRDGIETWIKYIPALPQPKGGWKASATGYVKITATGILHETVTKDAYGRDAGHAEEGARRRVQKIIDRTRGFWLREVIDD